MIVTSFVVTESYGFYGVDHFLIGGRLYFLKWVDLSNYMGFGSRPSLRMSSIIWCAGDYFRVFDKKFNYQAQIRRLGSRFMGCCLVLLSIKLRDLLFVDYFKKNNYRACMWVKVDDFRIIDGQLDYGFTYRHFQRITDVLQLSRIFRAYKVKWLRR
jgi:hypothetical protein